MHRRPEHTVLIMAGGTGGHVFPALAVAQELRRRAIDVQWLGTGVGIEADLVPKAGIVLHTLNMSGLRGKGPLSRILALFKAGAALLSAIALIRRLRPLCVLGLGGYAAGPGGAAAWLLRVPLLIHEQNAVAGTTNRLLARLAKVALTGYPIALGGSRNRYIGNPVRAEIANLEAPALRWQTRSGAVRLLVLGGSLGAKPINDAVVDALALLAADERPQVWHQTGKAHSEAVRARYSELGLEGRVEPFVDDMAAAYGWADLVLCRAGALTVAELAAAGVGAWLVPLPHAIDDHQRANARWLVDAGAGEIIDQRELTPTLLADKLRRVVSAREQLLGWAQAARRLARVDAAEQAANACLEYAHG